MGLGYRSNQRTKGESPTILVPSLAPDKDKRCWKCGKYKSIETGFYGDASRWDGLAPVCKECDNIRRVEAKRKVSKRKQDEKSRSL